MGKNWMYISGAWNLLCDVCNKKIKSQDARQRWDGFITCPDCFEHRHPQDFIRARADKISVPFSRPRPAEDTFVSVTYLQQYFTTDYIADNYVEDQEL